MTALKNGIWNLPDFERRLAEILNGRTKRVLSREGVVVAAVLIPLFRRNGSIHVLLTKRSNQVEHHKGEISFPGGKMDEDDPDLLHCALRETSEEVGMDPRDVGIVGELDDFYTVATSFLVAPFVGMIPYPYEFRVSQREIDEILPVPLEIFFDAQRRTESVWMLDEKPIRVISYAWEGYDIWGATARILEHFVDLLTDGCPEAGKPSP
jgi:8-oxo-dGTP pyrophosphatase MutT (NUDIX family)